VAWWLLFPWSPQLARREFEVAPKREIDLAGDGPPIGDRRRANDFPDVTIDEWLHCTTMEQHGCGPSRIILVKFVLARASPLHLTLFSSLQQGIGWRSQVQILPLLPIWNAY
jgi:hypothetical protein